jgi:hypothetical protein
MKVYTCQNKSCSLGTAGAPGRFTGGITAGMAHMLTGDPEAAHGEGYCPNCGKKGTLTKERS